jgi:hypothetical protein
MSQKTSCAIAVVGIDIGKNSAWCDRAATKAVA